MSELLVEQNPENSNPQNGFLLQDDGNILVNVAGATFLHNPRGELIETSLQKWDTHVTLALDGETAQTFAYHPLYCLTPKGSDTEITFNSYEINNEGNVVLENSARRVVWGKEGEVIEERNKLPRNTAKLKNLDIDDDWFDKAIRESEKSPIRRRHRFLKRTLQTVAAIVIAGFVYSQISDKAEALVSPRGYTGEVIIDYIPGGELDVCNIPVPPTAIPTESPTGISEEPLPQQLVNQESLNDFEGSVDWDNMEIEGALPQRDRVNYLYISVNRTEEEETALPMNTMTDQVQNAYTNLPVNISYIDANIPLSFTIMDSDNFYITDHSQIDIIKEKFSTPEAPIDSVVIILGSVANVDMGYAANGFIVLPQAVFRNNTTGATVHEIGHGGIRTVAMEQWALNDAYIHEDWGINTTPEQLRRNSNFVFGIGTNIDQHPNNYVSAAAKLSDEPVYLHDAGLRCNDEIVYVIGDGQPHSYERNIMNAGGDDMVLNSYQEQYLFFFFSDWLKAQGRWNGEVSEAIVR